MKTCNFTLRLAVLPLAVAAAFPSFSQTPNTPQLRETVVTATRNPQLLSSAVPHTTVISREDIERSQATDLVTLLAREAGLQRTQTGGIGTASSIFMRGAASLQTLVLLDGIALNKQDASGSVSLEHLMLDQIERVEIVRGNVSAIYGSGAIGGLVTKGISPRPRFGNPTPRICETAAGMLNSIGLENVGVEGFREEKLPYLRSCGAKVIVNFFGTTFDEYVARGF